MEQPMHPLFSPLRLAHIRLPNRLALGSLPSGLAVPNGGFTEMLRGYYAMRASNAVGLIVTEPMYAVPPRDALTSHLGLYTEAQRDGLAHCIRGIHQHDSVVVVMIDQPLWVARASDKELATLGQAFQAAAQRARAAGADGSMFSAGDGGLFDQLISPLQNQRAAPYGGSLQGRLKLLLDTIEALGRHRDPFIIGVRLNVEEFTPGGLSLPEARMIASQLSGAGVSFVEICAKKPRDALVAQFPGWQVPLAESLKSVVALPVMVGGQLDDPFLADSVIQGRSADLIDIGERLRQEPHWPLAARAALDARAPA